MKYLSLILGNLRRHKLRTALTLLSIIVAFLLFGYLAAIRSAFLAGIDVAGEDRLITRNKVSLINLMPMAHQAEINRVEGVDFATHNTWFGGIYQEPSNFFAQIVVVPEQYLELYPELELSDEDRQRWLETRTGVMIGKVLAERFDWKIGDKIPIMNPLWALKGGDRNWTFDVAAIYDAREQGIDTSQMFIRFDYFDEARQWGQGQVGWYVVRVDEPDRAGEIAAAIDAVFANSPDETKTEPEGAWYQGFANQVGNIGFIITAIVSAVFFTILLVAGNTMAYSVRERIGELAVLKAVGFTDGAVLGLVLGEALVITAIGGLIGLGLAWLLVAAGDPTNGAMPVFFISVRDLLLGGVLILALAFIAGIFPARTAQRLQVADALRR